MKSPRFTWRFSFCSPTGRVLLILLVLAGAGPAGAANTPETLRAFNLLSGVTATINTNGSLLVRQGAGTVTLLTTEVVPLTTNRRVREENPPPFTAVVTEGAPGGQRGFSSHRDDDGDGSVDEDPLDGQDNDGDGRVDEDFAAISDAMVVVHQDGHRGSGRASHLEYYHWSYPHLRSTIFLAAKGSPGLSNGGTYRLVLGDHRWYEATLTTVRHSLAGKGEAGRVEGYVAQPALPATGAACGSAAGTWIGVVFLSGSAARPVALDGGVLEVALGEDPFALAVCVAESWLQLNSMMNAAVRVQAGVQDKITGQRASWIVPPLCALCRLSAAPDFGFQRTTAGELVLTAHIAPDRGVALDPDLFQLAGEALGAPRAIQWQPDGGPVASTAWTCMSTALLDRPHDRLSDPYGQMPDLLSHQVAGRLRFVFSDWPPVLVGDQEKVMGAYLDGRSFEARLTEDQSEPTKDRVDQAPREREIEPHVSLSPQLLEGFPNPFRDYIQLRFAVPATVGEAFVWGDNQDPPAGVNLQAAVAWRSGTPSVSVRIYSLNGQELVTLFAASQGPGQNMVQWDGTDNYGRQVASGTYFCKLQMDEYSTTRRLVYLR